MSQTQYIATRLTMSAFGKPSHPLGYLKCRRKQQVCLRLHVGRRARRPAFPIADMVTERELSGLRGPLADHQLLRI